MERGEESWSKPKEGMLKINIYADWSGSNGQGFGMVVRDHIGECMFAASSFSSLRALPTVAEADALRWALQKSQRLELTHIILEIDVKNAVENILGRKDTPAIAPIIHDCRHLASCMEHLETCHTRGGGQSSSFVSSRCM